MNAAIPLIIAYMIVIVSMLMVVLNIFRRITEHKLSIQRLQIRSETPFLTSSNITIIIVESLLIMICPYPQLSLQKFCSMNAMIDDMVCYTYNDIFHFAQLYKMYFIITAFSVASEFANQSSYRACMIYGVENSITFVFRCLMQEYPFQLIIVLLTSGIAVFGYALRIAETPVSLTDKSMDLTGYFECCWCTMITMTTIGFGDYFPRSTIGRMVMFFTTIYGMIVTSLMVNFASEKLNLSQTETKAFTLINRLQLMKAIKRKSAEIIKSLGDFFILRKCGEEKAGDRASLLTKLVDKCGDLKEVKSEYRSIQDDNLEEAAERSFALVALEIEEMNGLMKKLKQSFATYETNKAKAQTQEDDKSPFS